jgi:Starch-binding associating with outer membrane
LKLNMKKIFLYTFLSFAMLGMSSCDKGFDELNVNPIAATTLDRVFILNNAIVSSSFSTATLVYDMGIVQQIVSPNSGVLTGANFNQLNNGNAEAIWIQFYRNVIRNTTDVINNTRGNAARANLFNMARIWQAFSFMVVTDAYGDVPYTEAGKGFLEGAVFPKYDTQESIYTDIIKELTEASAALNASGTIEVSDVMYGGDITRWKRLGYSLLLRAGMRLSKINPQRAQQVVQAAVQGGVIQSNADNCVIRHTANYTFGIGNLLNATEAANFYMTDVFVNALRSNNDPRLASMTIRYVGATSGAGQTAAAANRTADVQIGMPMGFDNVSIGPVATASRLASFYDYTQVDRTRMVKLTSPCFIVTHAQTQLLLAEAAQRGWASGSAAEFYANGARAHMAQMAEYDAGSAVPAAAIEAWVAANPYSAATGLQQINTQYWIASFLNGPEAWANFRRSGFPALRKNPFPSQQITGNFINRMPYPIAELAVNQTNQATAVQRQGADNLDTRVWWDRQ